LPSTGSNGGGGGSQQSTFGGLYCDRGYHRESSGCVRDAPPAEEPEKVPEEEEESESTNGVAVDTEDPQEEVDVTSTPNKLQQKNLITGNATGRGSFASLWPLLVLALIIIGLGAWYLVGGKEEPKRTAAKKRRR
jgi:hypothetical protein